MSFAYTTRIVGVPLTASQTVPLHEVPAGRVHVLRDIVAHNAGSGDITLGVWGYAQGANLFMCWGTIPSRGTLHVDLRQAMHAGDQLWFYSSGTAGSLAVTAYDLSAGT